MISKFPIALVCFASTVNLCPMILALSPQEVAQAVKPFTVRISSSQNQFSGTIIKRIGNEYQVLTTAAASRGKSTVIFTSDGQKHPIKDKKITSGVDTAVLTFSSSKNYPTATIIIGISGNINEIYVAGFPKTTRTITTPIFTVRPAVLKSRSVNTSLSYEASLLPGMEGGGIFDDSAKLIGINGQRVKVSNRQDQVNANVQFQSGTYTGIPIGAFVSASQSTGTGSYGSSSTTSGGFTGTSVEEIEAVRSAFAGWQDPTWAAANAKYEQGQYQEAIRLFDIHLKKYPKDGLSYSSRGIAKLQLGDKKGAIADFDLALKINPKLPGILIYRGIAKAQSGDQNGGIIDLQQAVINEPTSPDAHYYLALGLYERGDKAVAIASMKKAKSLYETQGNKAKAQELEQLLRRMQ
jgi:Tetratricopeptide repeat